MTVHHAIAHAESLIDRPAAPEGESDPRWQVYVTLTRPQVLNMETAQLFFRTDKSRDREIEIWRASRMAITRTS